MKKIYIILFLMSVLSVSLMATDEIDHVGTAGMPFLKIPVGVRNIALSGAAVADVQGLESIYLNPAGLSKANSAEILFSNTAMVLDISHTFVGLSYPLDSNSAIAFSGNYLNYGDEDVTTLESPEGTGVEYSAGDLQLAVTYAQNFTDRFSAGITFKYLQSSIWDNTGTAMAVDVGLIYDTGFKSLRLGMVMRHLGSDFTYEGKQLEDDYDFPNGHGGVMGGLDYNIKNQDNRLPTNISLSVAYDIVNMPAHKLSGYFSTFDPQDGELKFLMAGEYTFAQMLSLRAGYTLTDEEDYDKTFTAGAGFKFNFSGLMLDFGYAYTAMEELDDTHSFGLGIGF